MTNRLFENGNDGLLLQQVVQGDRGAFGVLYEKYWEFVYSEAYKRLKDREQSKDIVQEIFTHIWVKRETLCIENLPAYLAIAARNKVYKVVARQKFSHPYFDYLEDLPAGSLQADSNLLLQELFKTYEALLNTLPPKKQLIFRLRFQHDLSTSDIAHRLGLTRKTVQNQLGKAIHQLKVGLFYTLITLIFLFSHLGK